MVAGTMVPGVKLAAAPTSTNHGSSRELPLPTMVARSGTTWYQFVRTAHAHASQFISVARAQTERIVHRPTVLAKCGERSAARPAKEKTRIQGKTTIHQRLFCIVEPPWMIGTLVPGCQLVPGWHAAYHYQPW